MEWLGSIIARLISEGAESLSDAELERCLGRCVGAIKLVPLAKEYRDKGVLTINNIEDETIIRY